MEQERRRNGPESDLRSDSVSGTLLRARGGKQVNWEVFSVVVAIAGVGVALAVLVHSMKADNRKSMRSMKEENQSAHNRIEGNVNRVDDNLKDAVKGINENFNRVNDNFNKLFLEVGKVIGKQERSDE